MLTALPSRGGLHGYSPVAMRIWKDSPACRRDIRLDAFRTYNLAPSCDASKWLLKLPRSTAGIAVQFLGGCADYMRAAIRMAALSHAGTLFVMTHDSIGLGEDGPTHQPVEHLASFRAMPNILMLRPGDGNETAGAYQASPAPSCCLTLAHAQRKDVDLRSPRHPHAAPLCGQ